jgi:hypothetical protein
MPREGELQVIGTAYLDGGALETVSRILPNALIGILICVPIIVWAVTNLTVSGRTAIFVVTEITIGVLTSILYDKGLTGVIIMMAFASVGATAIFRND